MKKFVAIVLTLSIVLVVGAVASMAYPQSTKDWNVQVTVNENGGIDLTYSVDTSDVTAAWVEVAIYDHELEIGDNDMNSPGMPFTTKIERANNNSYPTSRTINKGEAGQADSYPFVEGTTYYVYLMACDSVNWVWNTVPTVFTYTTESGEDPEIVLGTGNYPSTNADFGVTTEVQADGSVIIAASKEAIDEAATAVEKFANNFSAGYIYVTIYSADPGFDSTSDMTGSGPFTDPTAGSGGAGRVDGDAFTYKIENSNTSEATPAYSFEEGNTYYVYICANDANNAGNWFWNYEGTSFVYEVPEEEEPTPTPTETATATPTATATATAGVTETAAATTEAATTEAAATTAAAETTAAATGTQSTDNTDDGGDFSVLIYLAAALVAGGGAAFAFRKKNRA